VQGSYSAFGRSDTAFIVYQTESQVVVEENRVCCRKNAGQLAVFSAIPIHFGKMNYAGTFSQSYVCVDV